MTDRTEDFADRLAARLLGVPLDADPVVTRTAFRRQVRAVHPDTAVGDACVDLGRLAEAKDRLLRRHAQRAAQDRAARWSFASSDRVGRLVDVAC